MKTACADSKTEAIYNTWLHGGVNKCVWYGKTGLKRLPVSYINRVHIHQNYRTVFYMHDELQVTILKLIVETPN